MSTNTSTLRSRKHRASIKELREQLRLSEAARISAEATKFAALNILEDIVSSSTEEESADGYAGMLISLSMYDRAAAIVNQHRGDNR
jgi:hypothetical protein